MASDIASYQGPQPRLHPIAMVIIFGILLTLFSAPAYNANGFRAFLRASGFLEGAETPEVLLIDSGKIFQTMDVMLGPIVALSLNLFGPRFTHSIGLVFFGVSLICMMHWYTLWFGMLLQGCAAASLLNSTIHLANLFEKGSNFAWSMITTSSEIGLISYPGLDLAVTDLKIPPKILILILIGICGLGFLTTIILFPDEVFFPRSEQAKDYLRHVSLSSLGDEEIATGMKIDSRDSWGDPADIIPNKSQTTIKFGEKSPLLTSLDSIESDPGRLSGTSVSIVSLMENLKDEKMMRPIEKSFYAQLCSPEWLLITLVFAFFVFRSNIYLDSNEQILKQMGDSDERTNDMIQLFALLMPFSFIPALLNVALINFIGVIPMILILNFSAIAVNILSMIQWLSIQKLTFVLFMFSRTSSWNMLFSFNLTTLGLRRFETLTGISLVFCGIINLALGTAVVHYVFRVGPDQWYWVNFGLAASGFVTFVVLLVLWLLQYNRTAARRPKR